MGNLLTSSIGKKLIMSISGAFLILFLIFHLSMNITALFSSDVYNMICSFLGANWYALVGTLVLAGGFIVHIAYATYLTLQNRKARGSQRYAVESASAGVKWASRNMFVLGLIVFGGLALHFYNFWYNMQFVEIAYDHKEIAANGWEPQNGAKLIADLFSRPGYCVIYLVWFAAIWFHLTHGFWSMFQTIGWNNKVWLKRMKCLSNIFATVIMLGYAAIVVVFYLRSICPMCAA